MKVSSIQLSIKYCLLVFGIAILFACSKDKENPATTGLVSKLEARMWVWDSAVTMHADGSKSVYIPPAGNLQFAMFTKDMINFYSSANDTAYLANTLYATYIEPDTIQVWQDIYKQGTPDIIFTVDTITSKRLIYSTPYTESAGVGIIKQYYHLQ